MSRTFPELYRPYNERLIDDLGLDWWKVERRYQDLGNSPGIYPDVGMLLMEVASRPDVGRVIEVGSGVSTLYLGAACRLFDKKFVSFEEDTRWLDITQQLCDSFGVKVDLRLLDLPEDSQIPFSESDALFLDAQQGLRGAFLANSNAINAGWILVDDCESASHIVPNLAHLARVGRTNIFLFNPVGRKDRHVLVNCKDNAYSIAEWVWSWRPDKVVW